VSYIEFLLLGLAAGAVYGLLGLGLVLEYRGSGIVNFAHGAMAMFIAYVFTDLRTNGNLFFPLPPFIPNQLVLGAPMGVVPAAIISLVYAIVLGYVCYAVIFRFLRTASSLGKVVTSIGLMLTLESVVQLQFGTDAKTPPAILPTTAVHLGGTLIVPQDAVDMIGITVLTGLVLWAVFRFTRFGLATRASAESEKGATLIGLRPGTIACGNWMIATVLAGASGILLSQITALSPSVYTFLIVPALAVSLVARFESFGLVVVAGIVLGMLESEVTNFQLSWSWVPQGAQDVLPLIFILLAIAIRGSVLPVRGQLLELRLPRVPRPKNIGIITAVSVVVGLIGLFALSGNFRFGLTVSIVWAFICLSFVVLTGFSGQISLCQLATAGVGGFTMSHLAASVGVPFPIDIIIAGLAGTVLGVLIGVPAQRARGVSLAVVTVAAAVTIDSLFFSNTAINGGFGGSGVPKLTLFGLNLDIRTSNVHAFPRPWFGVVALILLALFGLSVGNLTRTPTGLRMLAVRANERAAAAVGINVAGTKLYAFMVASFIAGVGGALLGYQQGVLSEATFGPFVSVSFLAIAFIGGIGQVRGAVLAGIFLATGGLMSALLDSVINFGPYLDLIGGVAVMASAVAYPNGMAGAPPPPFAVALGTKIASAVGRPAPSAAVAVPAGIPGSAANGELVPPQASAAAAGEDGPATGRTVGRHRAGPTRSAPSSSSSAEGVER
jgi:branched-subunit amino acid ABC-type transport system permease component